MIRNMLVVAAIGKSIPGQPGIGAWSTPPSWLNTENTAANIKSRPGATSPISPHLPLARSTALRDTRNGEKPRGPKPAARNAETGNALAHPRVKLVGLLHTPVR